MNPRYARKPQGSPYLRYGLPRFPTWGARTRGGTPEVFYGMRGGLAEAKVSCNGANI